MEILGSYSVAIRTIGLAGEKFRREIQSLHQQTIKPEKIVVYIAEECERPDWTIGVEKYVFVKRGMVAQRALSYDEIDSDNVLLLDDDVELASDSAEKMLRAMMENDADCVGADTYKNQDMPLWQKVYAWVTNWVCPHHDPYWAFKIHKNGSFTYLWNVPNEYPVVLPTQYVAGPCAMWKKETLKKLHWEDEVWMDEMEFSYMDDTVESYKLHVNGGKMFLLYNSGVENLNAKTASRNYRSKATMFYTRARLSFCVWWRTIYEVCKQESRTSWQQDVIAMSFVFKSLWLVFVNVFAGIAYLNMKIPYYYFKGIWDGWIYVHSESYRRIPSYKLI